MGAESEGPGEVMPGFRAGPLGMSRGQAGPLRGAAGLESTYQLPPTQADVPSNGAAGLRSLAIVEKRQ